MGVWLARVKPGVGLIQGDDITQFGITLNCVNNDHALPPRHLPGVSEQIGSTANNFHALGQSRVGRQPLRDGAANCVVAHQGIAQADHKDWFHCLRTRCTEHEMHGS